MLLHSDNDPFIPLAEAQHVAEQLRADLRVKPKRSHFFTPGEEIVEATYAVLERKLAISGPKSPEPTDAAS